MTAVGDAIVNNIVGSLARPGGNITGTTYFVPELSVKRLELVKETLPRVTHVAVLFNPNNKIAKALGLTIPKSLLQRADEAIQ